MPSASTKRKQPPTAASEEENPNPTKKKWTRYDELFVQRIADLQAYNEKHGHINVKWSEREDKSLYAFCRDMRGARKHPGKTTVALTDDRIASLDALRFDWSVRPREQAAKKSFTQRIEDLQAYKDKHGHVNVKGSEDKSLYYFCKNMRQSRKNPGKSTVAVNDERIASLDALGFEWTVKKQVDKSFEQRIEDLQAYNEKHGHVKVSQREDRSLYEFFSQVRRARKHPGKTTVALTDDRIASLDALRFDWSVRPREQAAKKSFTQRIEDLQAYKDKHGHVNVKGSEDKSLNKFCDNIRYARKHPEKSDRALTDDRIASLDALGFDWNLNSDTKSFEQRLEVDNIEEIPPMPTLPPPNNANGEKDTGGLLGVETAGEDIEAALVEASPLMVEGPQKDADLSKESDATTRDTEESRDKGEEDDVSFGGIENNFDGIDVTTTTECQEAKESKQQTIHGEVNSLHGSDPVTLHHEYHNNDKLGLKRRISVEDSSSASKHQKQTEQTKTKGNPTIKADDKSPASSSKNKSSPARKRKVSSSETASGSISSHTRRSRRERKPSLKAAEELQDTPISELSHPGEDKAVVGESMASSKVTTSIIKNSTSTETEKGNNPILTGNVSKGGHQIFPPTKMIIGNKPPPLTPSPPPIRVTEVTKQSEGDVSLHNSIRGGSGVDISNITQSNNEHQKTGAVSELDKSSQKQSVADASSDLSSQSIGEKNELNTNVGGLFGSNGNKVEGFAKVRETVVTHLEYASLKISSAAKSNRTEQTISSVENQPLATESERDNLGGRGAAVNHNESAFQNPKRDNVVNEMTANGAVHEESQCEQVAQLTAQINKANNTISAIETEKEEMLATIQGHKNTITTFEDKANSLSNKLIESETSVKNLKLYTENNTRELEALKKEYDSCKDKIYNVTKEKERVESELSGTISQLKQDVADQQHEHDADKKSLVANILVLNKLGSEKKEMEIKHKSELKWLKDTHKVNLGTLRIEMDVSAKSIGMLRSEADAKQSRVNELQSTLDTTKSEYISKLEQMKDTHKGKLDTLRTEMEERELRMSVSDAKYDSTISNLERRVNQSQATITKNTEQYKDLKLKHKQCKNDLQQVTEEKKTVVSQVLVNEGTITQLTKEIGKSQDAISSLETRVTAVVLEKNNLQTQITTLMSKNVNLNKKVTASKFEVAATKEELVRMKEKELRMRKYDKIVQDQLDQLSTQNTTLVKERDELNKKAQELKVSHDNEITTLHKEADAKLKSVEKYTEELKNQKEQQESSIEELCRAKQHQEEEFEKERSTQTTKLKRLESKLEKKSEEFKRLKSLRTSLKNGSKLPEGLDGLDKTLVERINNEIVDSGDEVRFDDIAGLDNAKDIVNEVLIMPMLRPELFTGLRSPPNGLLLFGPPGTGKTMIAKAIAHESAATFFSISSSSLTSKWVGEGEALVRTLFAVARYHAPSVIFIDEVDSMLTQRRTDEEDASRKMKTEFFVQLDGVSNGNEKEGRVLVIGATNLPHELDDAARRRFVKKVHIPLPDQSARKTLLYNLLEKNKHNLSDEDLTTLSIATDRFSGADLKNLCTDATMGPLRKLIKSKTLPIDAGDVPPITYKHFKSSLRSMEPSNAESDLAAYIKWNESYGSKVVVDNDDESSDEED